MVFDLVRVHGTPSKQIPPVRIAKDETTIVFLDPEGDYDE